MEKEIETQLLTMFSRINMDRPENFDDIVEFCVADIRETANVEFSEGDVTIAFRRYVEKLANN